MRVIINVINMLCIACPIIGYYYLNVDIPPVFFIYILIPIIYFQIKRGLKFTLTVYSMLTVMFIAGEFIASKFMDIRPLTLSDILTNTIGLVIAAILIIFMINQLMKENKHLISMVMEDDLTKLYNKRYFLIKLHEEISLHKKLNIPLSLLMVDLDRFKKCNDTCGHPTGDKLLKQVAIVIKSCTRENDVVARYGGEEFGIILPHTDEAKAEIIAERLRKIIEEHIFDIDIDNKPCVECKKTLSVGIATLSKSLKTSSSLIEAADKALYKAKELRNNIYKYSNL